MATYHIVHACGHTQAHQIAGPMKDRKHQEARIAEKLCDTCYRAKLATERAAINAIAATAATRQGLPALAGSEKQIAWAATIRQAALEAVEKLPIKDSDLAQQKFAALKAALLGHIEANWWIDHRDLGGDGRRWLILIKPEVGATVGAAGH